MFLFARTIQVNPILWIRWFCQYVINAQKYMGTDLFCKLGDWSLHFYTFTSKCCINLNGHLAFSMCWFIVSMRMYQILSRDRKTHKLTLFEIHRFPKLWNTTPLCQRWICYLEISLVSEPNYPNPKKSRRFFRFSDWNSWILSFEISLQSQVIFISAAQGNG